MIQYTMKFRNPILAPLTDGPEVSDWSTFSWYELYLEDFVGKKTEAQIG